MHFELTSGLNAREKAPERRGMAESSKKRKVGEDGIDSEASMASEAPLEMAQGKPVGPNTKLHIFVSVIFFS
jgi:hypothetical protein